MRWKELKKQNCFTVNIVWDTFCKQNALRRALPLQADNGFRLASEPHFRSNEKRGSRASSCATKKRRRGISPLEFCETSDI